MLALREGREGLSGAYRVEPGRDRSPEGANLDLPALGKKMVEIEIGDGWSSGVEMEWCASLVDVKGSSRSKL